MADVEIGLSVACVKFGGNTGQDLDSKKYKYFHTFDTASVLHEKESQKEIIIKLHYDGDENTDKRFEICSCVFSNKNLFVNPAPDSHDGKQKITITCKAAYENSMSHIIIMVCDTEKDVTFCCDPQVVNSLPPNP